MTPDAETVAILRAERPRARLQHLHDDAADVVATLQSHAEDCARAVRLLDQLARTLGDTLPLDDASYAVTRAQEYLEQALTDLYTTTETLTEALNTDEAEDDA